MKILMLGWELPPHNSGGLGVACYELCKALSASGADIEFIIPYSTTAKYDFMKVSTVRPANGDVFDLGLEAYASWTLNQDSKARAAFLDKKTSYELAVEDMVKTRSFDIIHAHDWLTFRAALRAKEVLNKPLILHIHSIEKDRAGGNYGNPLVREIEYTSMLMADKVIAVSQHTKNQIIHEYSIPAEKINVIHNSIEIGSLNSSDDELVYNYLLLMKQNGWRVVVNIGRLTVQKGLPNLIRAAKIVIDNNPKTFFLFVGSGEQRDELIEQAAALGIADKVIFTGFLRGTRWRGAYKVADLFAMPSVSEPFGLTPLEAIGYGTPALISKQSGVAEVINNCLKVDYWDVNEMANQITNVVRSDQLRDELHKNALDELEAMSWQKAAGQVFDIYHHHGSLAV